MKNRVLAFLVVFSALLCIVAPLAAQDDAGIYYRLALWDVKRTHWSSYEENFTKNQKPILDKLFADMDACFAEVLASEEEFPSIEIEAKLIPEIDLKADVT